MKTIKLLKSILLKLKKFFKKLKKKTFVRYVIIGSLILILPVAFLVLYKLNLIQHNKEVQPKTNNMVQALQYTAFTKYTIPDEQDTEFITLGLTVDGKQVLLNHKTTKLVILDQTGEELLSVILGQNNQLRDVQMAAVSPVDTKTTYLAVLQQPVQNSKTTPLFIYKITSLPNKVGLDLLKKIAIPEAGMYVMATRPGEFWVSSILNMDFFMPEQYDETKGSTNDQKEMEENINNYKPYFTTRIQIVNDKNIKSTSIKSHTDYMPIYWGDSTYTLLLPFAPISIKQLAVYLHNKNKIIALECPDMTYYAGGNFTGTDIFYVLDPNNCPKLKNLKNGLARIQVENNNFTFKMLPLYIQNKMPKITDPYDPILLDYILFKIQDTDFLINLKNSTLIDLTHKLSEKLDFIDPEAEHYVLTINTKLNYADILVNNGTILRVFKTKLK